MSRTKDLELVGLALTAEYMEVKIIYLSASPFFEQ